MPYVNLHTMVPMRHGSIPMSTVSMEGDDASTISAVARKVAFPRSHIDISLDNHYSSKVYNVGDPVSGSVTILTQRDVRFDTIQILLLGSTKTRVEGVGLPSESTHVFLKLTMPIPESTYPVPRVLEIGRPYTIPFNFVVPNYLTIGACHHGASSELVQDQHLRLPPTMGFWDKDDLSPQMAKVEYSIVARVYREPELGGKMIKVVEGSQQIRVLPAYMEDAPLSVTKQDKEYALSKSKTLRKSILSGKTGTITASAAQPEAVVLLADGRGISSTTAQVELKFDPASPDAKPPKVSGIAAKVTAQTFYSSGPINTLPNLGDWNRYYGMEKRGSYSTSVALSTPDSNKSKWTQETVHVRRDSGYSSGGNQTASDSEEVRPGRRRSRHMKTNNQSSNESPVFYASTLNVPIKLPMGKKTFIPTFHSCITSRTYTLHLAVSVTTGSNTTTLNLALPLQVVVDSAGQTEVGGLPSFETAVEEAEVDEYFRPRVLSVPNVAYQETSVLPGYGDLGGR